VSWTKLSAPFSLKSEAQYSAHIHLGLMERAVATSDMVVQKFTAAGFTEVTCSLNGADGTVYGVWGGPLQEAAVQLPSQVTAVWVWTA
jgi:hypothetical protein